MVIQLLKFVRCDFKPWHWLNFTKAVDRNSHTRGRADRRTRAHTRAQTHRHTFRVRSPTSEKISLNTSLKFNMLLCSCQWSMFISQWRVGMWSIIVSFPGHTHFFVQTHDMERHIFLQKEGRYSEHILYCNTFYIPQQYLRNLVSSSHLGGKLRVHIHPFLIKWRSY